MMMTFSSPTLIGYLGPEGSNSEQSLLQLSQRLNWHAENYTLLPYPSLLALVDATERGAVAFSAMPYENALEGSVVEVLEALGQEETPLKVHAEYLFPVQHAFLRQSATASTPIHTVWSHPMALAQCKKKLRQQFGIDLKLEPHPSTSEAVVRLAHLSAEEANGIGVLANPVLGSKYPHLQQVHLDLSDTADNLTRFLLVSNQAPWAFSQFPLTLPTASANNEDATDQWKTSISVSLHEYPGVLMEYLQVFHRYWMNLSRIESRPTRKRYGDYRFHIDVEGQVPLVAEGRLLTELQARSTYFNLQGPYRCLGRTDATPAS
jgi:prephenate dehydratase